ncbi:dihydroorotase [Syntrophus aciditrophicus]|uniref:Dihydroorotase n=1 Tax=Syntrophus aciditrophicus (strain SB) TaxID=56780 RepID=PYRC_SYNAS|nr:dihydroorotase [Syntrophus aciditrophicus]Q2LVI3.1 RecName: Full=Dihydroorotase; Short=DHOase [Syntrophus aciditrophicus SB]ABC78091.1 dihydroorotase [Syntrophus aciditrophicus SB]
MKILLKGGRVIDPAQNLDGQMDLLLENGKIAAIAEAVGSVPEDTRLLDLKGMILLPGLVDMHTHLREPGYEYKETIRSGSEAAAVGGFTSIACMPNTLPVNDNRTVTEYILKRAKECDTVHVYPVAAVSRNSEGKILAEFGDLKEAGAIAFSDDGKPVMNSILMRRALEYASSLDRIIISHCEDLNLSAGGLMNEGKISTELGLPGIPTLAEDVMVARDLLLAEFSGAALHIAHVSSAGAVRMIRDAKKRGVRVTAETTPHYFTLTDEAVTNFNTNTKVSPPLRSREDLQAVREGLRDGTLDAIVTDHAPHALTDKEVEFEYAANGISGLETALALSLTLVDDGLLTLSELVRKMSVNPAKILNIPKGTLRPGADADITVLNPGKTWVVDPSNWRSQGKNTPFFGWTLKGKVIMTLVQGRIVYQED